MIHFNLQRDSTMCLISPFPPFHPLPLICEDLQMICGFSCEDLISMFKELKSLGVVVKELSNELRQLVSDSELLENCFSPLQIISLFLYLQFHQVVKSVKNHF